ncbi:MAG: NDP-sugar synthase [Proteobacteria bacterium]|nr:NDP-sugar synthase [Pseudomonadota bacterium]
MKAVILCAGYGTRLKPLTDMVAKPLVKILSIPILEYTLSLLEQSGVNEVFINRHHFPEQFEKIKIPKNMKIGLSLEKNILGTLGGVLSFEEYLKEDDFIVINGDILFNIDIEDLINKHKRKKSIATMVVRENEGNDTPVFVDDFSNIVSIGGDSGNIYKKYMFAGIHVMNPEFFNVVKKKNPPSWKADGGIEKITELVEGIWAGTDNYIDPDSTVSAPVFMGRNVKIEKEAFVGPNVIIGDNVTISENTHVKDSLILDDVQTEKNKHLYRTIVSNSFTYEDKE